MQLGYNARLCLSVLALGLFSVHAQANDVLYVCESPDGVRTYKNTDIGKDCEPLSLNPITIVPSPSERAGGRKLLMPQQEMTIPSGDLGVVDSGSKVKDQERIRIIKQELLAEEARLEQLESEYNGGVPDRRGNESNYQRYLDRKANLEKEIGLASGNIKLLRKELLRLTEG